tara:strand:- start:2372 stop:3007 length:636 start_codon:yes stop_codon:yes gene_type:complete
MKSLILTSTGDLVKYVPDDYPGKTDHTIIDTLPAEDLTKPQWNGSSWIETGTQEEQDNNLTDYKLLYQIKIDNTIGQTFWDILTAKGVSLQGQSYIMLAHLFKAMEAQDVINDRDTKDWRPHAFRRDGGNNKKRRIIEKEAAKRGCPEDYLSDLVVPWAEFQWDIIADFEEIRPTTKDAITAAVDHAAVDAVYAQFQTDLGTVLAGLTPPS